MENPNNPLLSKEKMELTQSSEKKESSKDQSKAGLTSSTSSVPKKGPKTKKASSSSVSKSKPPVAESRKEESEANKKNSAKQKGSKGTTVSPLTLTNETDEGNPCSKRAGISYYGIKSYLHQFYENASQGSTENPAAEDEFHYLLRPKRRTCGGILFKIGLITGATLFLLGVIAIIIGYAIPMQEEVRGETDEFKIIDRNAMGFNRNLDTCKLIGLAMFCSGGLVLVISLLAPTFTSSYWDEDLTPEGFRVPLHLSPIPEDEPRSPIPVTQKIHGIQPAWAPK